MGPNFRDDRPTKDDVENAVEELEALIAERTRNTI